MSAISVPAGGEQLPADTDQLPAASDQLPAVSDQLPAVSDQLPAVSDQLPAVSDQLPAGSDAGGPADGPAGGDAGGEQPVLVRTELAGAARVTHIVLNRPGTRNAITIGLAVALRDALQAAASQADVVVIRGAGGHFCAGGDFREVSRLREQGPGALRPLFATFMAACELITELPVPVVAAVEGYAMAGGFELIQACDIAVARDDAVLADNHLNFAMVPGGGGSQRLPRIVGPQRALGHILTGDRLTGAQAAAWGLVYRSVPAEEFEAAVTDLVTNLAGKDGVALARAKRLVREGLRRPLANGLALETEMIIAHLGGAAAGAGITRFTRGDHRPAEELS